MECSAGAVGGGSRLGLAGTWRVRDTQRATGSPHCGHGRDSPRPAMDRPRSTVYRVVPFGCVSDRKERGTRMKYGSRIIAVFLVFGCLLRLLSLAMLSAHLAQ